MASQQEPTSGSLFSRSTVKDLPGEFPPAVIVPPILEHKHTFIILHGRGSTAEKFGPPLLSSSTTSGEKLQDAFPHAKLVFLTAPKSRATIFKRSYTHQWFDMWHMEARFKRQDLVRNGLGKSCKYILGILQQEIDIIGKDVVLWGLSQGCATSLTALLAWDGLPFAAMVGMCGYLPFTNHMEDIIKPYHASDDNPFGHDDPFQSEENTLGGLGKQNLPAEAIKFLIEEINMGEVKTRLVFQQIPIFMGHGTEDEKVGIEVGREAKNCLDLLEAGVKMVEYEGLGHWYSDKMLDDIFEFLGEKLATGHGH